MSDRHGGFDGSRTVGSFTGATLSFWGLTELAIRDPNRVRKEQLRRATEELRFAMAQRAERRRLTRALYELPRHLHAIWGDRALSPGERERRIREIGRDIDPKAPGARRARR